MVSHTIRPSVDDKCSDVKQSVKCFEAIICAARTRLSNEEIESYTQQAFNLESSPKRLGDLVNRRDSMTRAMFCMATFCASLCQTFEATVNISVNINLQVCGHKLPGCGAKRTSHEDFISQIRKGEEVIPGLKLLIRSRSASHIGSITNRLLRFYREKAGLEKQPNPVQTLLQRQTLIEPATNPKSEVQDDSNISGAVQDCKAAIKRAASVDTEEDSDDGLLYKRVKRSATASPESKANLTPLKATNLRKELEEFMNSETGWLSKAQRLQSQFEEQEKIEETKRVKAEAEEKIIKSNSVTVKVLQAHVKQLEEYLSQEKQRTGRLTNSLARVEERSRWLEDEVSRRTQEARSLNKMYDEDRKRFKERVAEVEAKLRRVQDTSHGKKSRGHGSRRRERDKR